MYKRNEQDKEEKRKIEGYTKSPMTNFSDSINRSKMGDLELLTRGGCLNKVITLVLILGILFLISRCT